ncbi:hypothetical protein PDESU_06519 [Pontiella desulfatans]|uniref:AB hydrolase-1 domain-containing protein n=1 Tax=Pontiella desulfatans TaxID=2750659 RepID=A0A6C2UEF7_PONDE|nr:alpha/beta hydrolase [Pontiella desulfatans]VGO17917.1 hypothetical protein PDESU_06519 [Pontiella desulfatans]
MGKSPVIMLSGMGADARVFKKQLEAIPQMSVPKWIEPQPGESLRDYAGRFAKRIDPGMPCHIGGASFGGFVALEMVRHLHVAGCFLVGSVRVPEELPRGFKVLNGIPGVAGAVPFEVAALLGKAALLSTGRDSQAHHAELMKQLADSDAAFLRWACRAVLGWSGAPDTGDTPIHQIHGSADVVLPVRNTRPDVVVPGAGHALSMSHPDEVTEFILKRIQP